MTEHDTCLSIFIVGAGGLGREALQCLLDAIAHRSDVVIKGFLDDRAEVSGLCSDFPLLGSPGNHVIQPNDRFVMGIGDPEARAKVIKALTARGGKFFSLIHPTAHIARTAMIGEGCVIAPFCAIGNNARLGDYVLMNWYSSVAHDAHAESYSVLSPYSTINGASRLGEGAFLGSSAVVNPLRAVGPWAKVSAGSVVYKDVPAGHLAMGNPAKFAPLVQKGEPNG